MLYSIVVVLVLILDQAVKFYTVRNIPPQAVGDACKTLIPGVIHMTNVQNYGAAFSIMENAQVVLVIVSVVFIVGIIILISMDIIHTKFGRWTAVLVMAGALGNCIDRVLLGYVVDMFEFELFNFAVFNVADIFITVCGILFCLHVIIYREPEEERNAVPRPEKKRSKLFASRQKPAEEEYDDAEDAEEDVPVSRHSARASGGARSARQERAVRVRAVKEAPIPHRDRSAHRSLEEDIRPADPDNPFAEWMEEDDDTRPQRAAQPAAGQTAPASRSSRQTAAGDAPAPRRVRKADAEASGPAAPRPAKRRTAPTVADSEDDLKPDMSAPEKPSEPEKAAPVQPAQPGVPSDAGFEGYSLDDILAEFRDT